MMHKRFLIILGVLASFLWCSLALSTLPPKKDEKKDAATAPATEKKIDFSQIQWRTPEQFRAAIVKESQDITDFQQTMSTGVFKTRPEIPIPTASPVSDTAGYTYYDFGSNARMGRWIALSILKYAHAVWTASTDSVAVAANTNPREVYYSAWVNTGARGGHEIQVNNIVLPPPGARGGFPSVAVTQDGRAVACYHQVNPADVNKPGTFVSVEITPALGNFEQLQNAPDSNSHMTRQGFWPSVATHTVPASGPNPESVIVHVVTNDQGGGNTDYTYGRGRELGGGITWSVENHTSTYDSAVSADSGDDISVTVVASQKSGKVAIVYVSQKPDWNTPVTDEDLFYIESTNYGRDWVNGFNNNSRDTAVNVTKYAPGSQVRATGVLSAVYDEDDSLHIVWVAPLYNAGDVASECYIYHWSKATGIDQVADGTYNFDDNYLTNPSRTFNLNNPAIGVHDGTGTPSRKGYLYVVYNQYGPGISDASVKKQSNGEIYINASTNGGNTWGNPINITNSHTPGCDLTTHNCDSDVFPSCAERVNDTVQVLYINDKSAGSILDNKGGPALNPVYYLKYPAYLPAAFNGIAAAPAYFDDPVANISIPDLVIDTQLTISNVGNQTLTITSVTKAGGSPWLKLQTVGFPDAISEGGAPKVVACTLNGTGLGTGTYLDTIIVNNNSNNAPAMRIPVHFVVTDCGYFRRKHVFGQVGTADTLVMKIGNTSSLVDQDLGRGLALSSLIDPLNKLFLYDGSGVLTTITSTGDTIAAFNLVGSLYIHPLTDISDPVLTTYTDSVTYSEAMSLQRPAKAGTWLKFGPVQNAMFFPDLKPNSCGWPGPWFGYWIQSTWYMPSVSKPRYLLWFTKIYKAPPPCWWPLCETGLITNNLYAGSVLDWDVPSDSQNVWNSYGNNDTLQFVWQQGYGTPENNYYAATAAMLDTGKHIGYADGFWSAHVQRHNPPDSVSGAFPNQAGILYRVMSASGFNPITNRSCISFPPPCDTTVGDRHTIFGSVKFAPSADSVKFCEALVISNVGYDSLQNSVKQARKDMRLALPGGCTYRPADVDGNGAWSLTDIIGLVNIVFKGTAKPSPLCRTDCNASGGNPNLSDIICLVNKVFKGAPNPPPSGECCKP